ncbi:MAG: protein jag [Clostridiales bacterium]|nr:protein jag [Clostridiales bacterium]
MVKKETIAEGRTVEAAVSAGAAELGSTPERVTYEIIETPKRGFLGFGETPAKVKVIYQIGPEDVALSFIRTVIDDMGIAAEAEISRSLSGSGDRQINIFGSDAGMLIGHHGETLDSLQFLCNLAVNKDDEDEDSDGYTRIVVDVENYRAKREDTLRTLARSMAARVKKYRRNITLEPMNPYERRIIHSEIQNIPGVSTISVGQDDSRRVVIYYEEPGKPSSQLAQLAAAEALRSGDGLGEDDVQSSEGRQRSGRGDRRRQGGDKRRRNAPEAGENAAEYQADDEASAESAEDGDREEALSVLRAQKPRRRSKKPTPPALQSDSVQSETFQSENADTEEPYEAPAPREYERRERGDRRDRRDGRDSRGSSGGARPPKRNKTEDLIAQTIASFKAENAGAEQPSEAPKPEFRTQAVVDDTPIIMNANAGSDK